MDYVNPKDLVQDAILLAEKKAVLSITDMLIRGALSGGFLGFTTSLTVVVTARKPRSHLPREPWARTRSQNETEKRAYGR